MPRVVLTEGAARGLERCREFLAAKTPHATKRAARAIARQFLLLETAPGIGRPLPELPELRGLVIPFAGTGYVALYRHEPAEDVVYVLAFRHQKNQGAERRSLLSGANNESRSSDNNKTIFSFILVIMSV